MPENDTAYALSRDRTPIFVRSALPPPGSPPDRAVAIILHGIAWHSRPYVEVCAAHLVPRGIAVYGMDLRGHGLSGGERGVLADLPAMLDDVAAVLDLVAARHPGAPPFLVAESMGALYALAFAALRRPDIGGLILLAPGIFLSGAQILTGRTVIDALRALRHPRAPTIDIVHERLAIGSRGEAFLRLRRGDELALDRLSLAYLWRLARVNAAIVARHARQVRLPTLVLQGTADRAVSPVGARWLHWVLPSADKRLVLFPDAPHNLLWHDVTPDVFAAIVAWLPGR